MTRPTPSARAAYPVFFPIHTRWNDNDVYGHVNNAVHYTWFDTAANAWLIREGLLDPKGGEIIGLMVASSCTYFAEVSYPGMIEIGMRIERIGTSSVSYAFGVFAEGRTASAADAAFTHVYVARATRRPVPLPDDWRTRMGAISG